MQHVRMSRSEDPPLSQHAHPSACLTTPWYFCLHCLQLHHRCHAASICSGDLLSSACPSKTSNCSAIEFIGLPDFWPDFSGQALKAKRPRCHLCASPASFVRCDGVPVGLEYSREHAIDASEFAQVTSTTPASLLLRRRRPNSSTATARPRRGATRGGIPRARYSLVFCWLCWYWSRCWERRAGVASATRYSSPTRRICKYCT
jgi:hypothetical protein